MKYFLVCCIFFLTLGASCHNESPLKPQNGGVIKIKTTASKKTLEVTQPENSEGKTVVYFENAGMTMTNAVSTNRGTFAVEFGGQQKDEARAGIVDVEKTRETLKSLSPVTYAGVAVMIIAALIFIFKKYLFVGVGTVCMVFALGLITAVAPALVQNTGILYLFASAGILAAFSLLIERFLREKKDND